MLVSPALLSAARLSYRYLHCQTSNTFFAARKDIRPRKPSIQFFSMSSEVTQTVDTTRRLARLREILSKETPKVDVFVVPSEDARA